MNKFLVTITQINDNGKIHEIKEETDTLINATRIILTMKPKRNYEIVSFLVTPTTTLI